MKPKTLYGLLFYEGGKVVGAISTTDIKLARKEYQRYYKRAGIAPRLLIDGVRQKIHIADEIMKLPRAPKIGRKKPPYVNRHQLKAKTL